MTLEPVRLEQLRPEQEALGLGDALAQLSALCASAAELSASPEGLELLARTLLGLRWLQDQLRELGSELEEAVGQAVNGLPGRLLAVEGLGVLQARWSSAPRSQSQEDKEEMARLAAEWAQDHRQLSRTGEVEAPEQAVLRALLAGFSLTPRKTALRKMGVDPDEWGEQRSSGRWSCKVLQNDERGAAR